MRLDVGRIAEEIETRLGAVATPERAAAEKRYLKSSLEHLGATVAQIRGEVRTFARGHASLAHTELVALVKELWSRPVHERRMAATMLLDAYPELVVPGDLALLERLIRESRTWAYVDGLAGDVTGKLLVRHPRAAPKLDLWAADEDFWVRRAALLAMLKPLKNGVPFERFAGYADAMLDETQFFVRKAIGWVLRDVGKSRGQEVFEWLAPRTQRASGVTVREAVKYLAPDQRSELLLAYREKRPAHVPRR
ncbi:MAG TPA: DNA alkylation repair protein [Candidatus Dormibacteraeota bacterium]